MNTVNFLLIGAVTYMILKSSKSKSQLETKSQSLSVAINLNKFITPFNPGIVQYGELIIYNNSDTSFRLKSLMLRPQAIQITQAGKEINIYSAEGTLLNTTLSYHNKYYQQVPDTKKVIIEFPDGIDIVAHGYETFGISITNVKYWPANNPVFVTDDFARVPFTALYDVNINDSYESTVEAEFSPNHER